MLTPRTAQQKIHKTMREMLGLVANVKTDRLPAPLEPGEMPRRLPSDSTVMLWNPEWGQRVSAKANLDYIQAAVNQVMKPAKVSKYSKASINETLTLLRTVKSISRKTGRTIET
jgi:hypothetical protein